MTTVSSTSSTTSTSTSSSSSASSLTSDYTTFLQLLTAQVQNQDPLSPMDTTEWTNQLVQYSSVEQEMESNEYLSTIADALTSSDSDSESLTDAVSYIGKTVSTDEDTATVTSGGSATWDYDLGDDATSATLTITDSDGNTIWSDSADDLSEGTHSFTWDGTDSSGNAVSAGDYTLSITASNSSGSVDASVGVSGTVTAVQEDDDGDTVLKVGNSTVAVDSVTSVS
ncbi:MAG: flagellar hook capping FlgD N-terminal domain-containing protein [Asticcacaulis sp.]|uniref:flagellar hook assembly protein FlgD n=1 Tax=Asticcacaulis sp. TaxID=1872648 RepID=UPI0039E622C8